MDRWIRIPAGLVDRHSCQSDRDPDHRVQLTVEEGAGKFGNAGLPAARRLNSTYEEEEEEAKGGSLYPRDLLLGDASDYANGTYFNVVPAERKFLAVFHVIGMAYMVLGLNTVCDVYFAGSIDLLCDAWDLTPDVAGATCLHQILLPPILLQSFIICSILQPFARAKATWMAAGGSAPEFFTSIIGATIAQNDIGFGTIVGSAVFNVLFVIGLCGYLVQAWEAGVLFTMYICYVLFMLVNRPLNVWAYEFTGTPLNKELREYVQDDDEPDDFMEIPEGKVSLIIWLLCLPVYIPLYYTLPWPSKGSKLYMVSFGFSLLWIGGFAFLLVWWTEIVASVIGIPTIISGLTFLAAATSIPDAVSSMAVARKGQADMAVSSSVGSNIFDILVGLPIPWLLKNAIESSNEEWHGVSIRSPYLMFYTCLLTGVLRVRGSGSLGRRSPCCNSRRQTCPCRTENWSGGHLVEGGKTAPINHEGSGWKWVIREEEEVKQSAAEAQMAALKQAAAMQLAQVEAQKAAELARAQAEAKAYAAAREAALQSKECTAAGCCRHDVSLGLGLVRYLI
eukprot:g8219.t1